MKKWLFQSIDNSPLVIFRIIFGFLITCESWGAIATGWVTRTLVEPQFTFNFISVPFLQPLPGAGMYYYFFVMGITGLAIMLGYRYVIASFGFCVLWAGAYFMQKSSYNNHYYLLWLLSIIMSFLPANKDLSLDVRLGNASQSNTMPNWVRVLIIAQLFIVYTFASVAKLYPDWLNTSVAQNLMAGKVNYPIIGEVLQKKWIHYIITYVGIFFDLLIVPALMYKPIRKIAFSLSVFFHLYNSIVFQIGIFPYLALGFSVFFFESEKIRKWFYPKIKKHVLAKDVVYSYSKLVVITICIWLSIQLMLPLRHWFIKGDVLYTEEGHRMSWRMMLRSKSGYNKFYIVEKGSSEKKKVRLSEYLTSRQIRSMGGKPDMIWQFAQYLKKEYAKKDIQIQVYVSNSTSVNKGPRVQLIDPNINLAKAQWSYFGHNHWVNTGF